LPAAPRNTSAIKAMMPPSPLLSARMMKITYLMDTTKMSDQNTSDSTPSMCAGVTGTGWWAPAKTSFRA
jgi:hypothetical protein